MGVLAEAWLAITGLLALAVAVWSAVGVRHAWALLAASPPEQPTEPRSRLDQIRRRLANSARGITAVFVAALVGAVVADYDRDLHNGVGNLISFFLFALGVWVVWWGLVLAAIVRRTANCRGDELPRFYGAAELTAACLVLPVAILAVMWAMGDLLAGLLKR
jgi:hypothetical protein